MMDDDDTVMVHLRSELQSSGIQIKETVVQHHTKDLPNYVLKTFEKTGVPFFSD